MVIISYPNYYVVNLVHCPPRNRTVRSYYSTYSLSSHSSCDHSCSHSSSCSWLCLWSWAVLSGSWERRLHGHLTLGSNQTIDRNWYHEVDGRRSQHLQQYKHLSKNDFNILNTWYRAADSKHFGKSDLCFRNSLFYIKKEVKCFPKWLKLIRKRRYEN